MLEGLDWQPILIAAIGIMSLVNGLSVFQNFRVDRPDVRIEPVFDKTWMWWSELIDTNQIESIRRYIVVGNLGRSNHGRRPTSISDTQLRIRQRNLCTATSSSSLYDIPQPEIELEGGVGNCFKSKLFFRYVDFTELVKRVPTLEDFLLKNLEQAPE